MSTLSDETLKDDKSSTTRDASQIEPVRTISRVPGNSNYYEKNGLRTEGDGVDHSLYHPGSPAFIMTVIGCACALAGSQIVPLLYLTLATTISRALDATNLTIWLFTSIIVAMGALAPFVGPLADLFGRKQIFLIGFVFSIGGSILSAVTPNAAGFIGGQVLLGFGAVVQELLAIAVVAECVPTSKRPMYAALVLCAIIPWTPGTLYSNWMAASSWRWIGCVLGIWNLLNMTIIWAFYRPPPRVNSLGLSRKEMVKRIDFIGGFLITTGLVLFLVGLNWGGQAYSWASARVLSFLIVGACLMIAFGFWEFFGAPYPLFPRRIIHAPRPFFCMLLVILAAGINYIPLVVFWPIQTISVFQSDLYHVGVNTLPIGTCILGGAILSALLISIFKRQATYLMCFFCIMQTIASACLTLINPHDIRTAWLPLILALTGVGGVLVPNQVIITVITPDDLIASVTALTVGLRAQAQVIGIAIFYNRFSHEVKANALDEVVPALVKAGVYNAHVITEFITGLTAVSFRELAPTIPQLGDPESYQQVMEACIQLFSNSFTYVYYVTIAFGVVACVASACLGDISQYMDDHVAVVL